MARHKLDQIRLVSANGTTQPPFPGGWVLAIFDAVHSFASDLAQRHRLPASRRTHSRIKAAAKSVKQSTYDETEARVVGLVDLLFPNLAEIKDFTRSYVDEYFRLWKCAAEFAPHWVKAYGFQPEPSGVLSRALVRDLILRLCYLESCERSLSGMDLGEDELRLLRHTAPAKVYAALIDEKAHAHELSMEALARALGGNVYPKKLQRLKNGQKPPEWNLLKQLPLTSGNHRVLAGIGFLDVLIRRLGLSGGGLEGELLEVAENFLPKHSRALVDEANARTEALDTVAKPFARRAARGDYLLLHPGIDSVWPKMRDALWRAHVYTLQFARVVDLAQAYFQFARSENDRELVAFLDNAERESDSCHHHWINALQRHNNIVPLNP